MLRDSFSLTAEYDAIVAAIEKVLSEGWRTADIYSEGCTKVRGSEMAQLICDRI